MLSRTPQTPHACWLAQANAELIDAAGEQPVAAWSAVVGWWDRAGRPYRAAVAWFRHADALLRSPGRSARADATSPASQARQVCERLGAAPLSENIDDLAHSARLRPDHAGLG